MIRERLRAAGLRATAARVDVLEAMLSATTALTHPELAARLPQHDRATVYRNLVTLAEAGLLRRFDAGDHAWRFEPVRDRDHAHFVCGDCGDVSCLPELELQLPAALRQRTHEVQLVGRCDACA